MKYYIKYRDINVVEFDTDTLAVKILHKQLLPVQISNCACNFTMIQKFCDNRALLMNRKYSKDILASYGIENQTNINICLIGNALSFRDCYWINQSQSNILWKDINLYDNKFSVKLSKTALTGIHSVIDDSLYTGELTGKGTRAKGFFRQNNGKIALVKAETIDEINAEILTYVVSTLLELPCTIYKKQKILNKLCSVCEIQTCNNIELIPFRDYMDKYLEHVMSIESDSFKEFTTYAKEDFIKMCILDYVLLNIDRNRDNFGLQRINGVITGMYPMFDHDSCLKGVHTNGIYFPTGLSFAKTLELIKRSNYYNKLYNNIKVFEHRLKTPEIKDIFLRLSTKEKYNGVLQRASKLL